MSGAYSIEPRAVDSDPGNRLRVAGAELAERRARVVAAQIGEIQETLAIGIERV